MEIFKVEDSKEGNQLEMKRSNNGVVFTLINKHYPIPQIVRIEYNEFKLLAEYIERQSCILSKEGPF